MENEQQQINPKIWKMSMGTDTDYTDEQYRSLLENKIVGLGMRTAYATNPHYQSNNFINQKNKGDVFYLVRKSKIILLGVFVGDPPDIRPIRENDVYSKYEELFTAHDQENYNICAEAWTVSKRTTFWEIPEEKYQVFEEFILNKNFNISLTELFKKANAIAHGVVYNKSERLKEIMLENIPLNQILYGPPGTGKTYNTVIKALKITESEIIKQFQADGEKYDDYKNKLLPEYNKLKKSGQIEFVTFHQSYGYEEFVEGIKPIPVGKLGNETEQMIYDVVGGVFKNIVKNINDDQQNKLVGNYERKFTLNASSINIQANLIERGDSKFYLQSGSKVRKATTESFDRYTYPKLRAKFLEDAKFKEMEEWFILETEYQFSSKSAASSIVLGRQSNGESEWKEIFEISNYKDNHAVNKKYVLIIDEINRGNISKIFGELITLVEESKRSGNDEAMAVTLPYSGESFSVPNNLYIIGTMNTADRSIALMDTALRRRFEFVEMQPDYCALEKETTYEDVNLSKLLQVINQRIEYLYDRDHTIGHAYFMGITDFPGLCNVFANKIIPLLQEYFYDDWEKIRLVLADNQVDELEYQFIQTNRTTATSLFGASTNDLVEADKMIYAINKALKPTEKDLQQIDIKAFTKIYNNEVLKQINKPASTETSQAQGS